MAKPGIHLKAACAVCKAKFRQSRSDQIYCSGRCASKAWRNQRYAYQVLTCPICNAVFARRNSKHKFCSRDCAAIAESAKRRCAGGPGKGWSGGTTKVPREICRMCRSPFYASPTLKRRGGGKFCSRRCYAKHVATHPELYQHTTGRRGKGGKREDLDGIYFRSSWEANWARYLNWLISIGEVVSWKFESETFEFHGTTCGVRFYTPDFRVVTKCGSVERHEVKGVMDEKSLAKLDCMTRYYPEVKIVLIDKNYYGSVASKHADSIPGWERVRGQASRKA